MHEFIRIETIVPLDEFGSVRLRGDNLGSDASYPVFNLPNQHCFCRTACSLDNRDV